MKELHKSAKFWLLYHVGMLSWGFLAAMVIKYNQEGDPFPPTFLVPFISIFLISSGIGYLASFMTVKATKLSLDKLRKWLLPALLIFYAGAFLISNLVISLGVLGWFIYSGRDLNEFFPHLFRNELNLANSSFAMWLMFFTIGFFYVIWQKSSRREQNLINENLKYRYNTLKSQINPHFLFNSFNTLSELVYVNPQRADNYIQKLSGIYRYILENEQNDLIPLPDEIQFVERYMALQDERNKGTVKLLMDIKDASAFEIIPVSLQILIENALKHNEASKKAPLEISIFRKGEYLLVTNNKQAVNMLEPSTRTGLTNLSERAKIITEKDLIIRDSDNKFEVLLPLIRKSHESTDHRR
ncbi:sensor histidine kinase [Marinilabilia sp.]|uniref:sensor histidine kinase n=1 Tax=Marinilabilia sp. TaxID=2021252 RepID=UPI0025C3E536|nr:histidine kinase [Marinilabilia sp.]